MTNSVYCEFFLKALNIEILMSWIMKKENQVNSQTSFLITDVLFVHQRKEDV